MLRARGVFALHHPLRNEQPAGYPGIIDVYVYVTPATVILSYGDRAAKAIPQIQSSLTPGMDIAEIRAALEVGFSTQVHHNIKYIYKDAVASEQPARRLSREDYDMYLDFFREANAGVRDTSWVRVYFDEIADKGYCHGIVRDHRLVSVTDAPDMPFMSGDVQEIGIHTLPRYRGKGYAKRACGSCIAAMLSMGIAPQWSTESGNLASQKLAASVGFEKLFDNLTVSLPQ